MYDLIPLTSGGARGSAELLAVKQIFIQEELELGNDVSSLSLQRVQSWEQIQRELDVLRLLQRHGHRNVVRFVGSGELLLLLPVWTGGSNVAVHHCCGQSATGRW